MKCDKYIELIDYINQAFRECSSIIENDVFIKEVNIDIESEPEEIKINFKTYSTKKLFNDKEFSIKKLESDPFSSIVVNKTIWKTVSFLTYLKQPETIKN